MGGREVVGGWAGVGVGGGYQPGHHLDPMDECRIKGVMVVSWGRGRWQRDGWVPTGHHEDQVNECGGRRERATFHSLGGSRMFRGGWPTT